MRIPLLTTLVFSLAFIPAIGEESLKKEIPPKEAASNEVKETPPVIHKDSVLIDGKKISYQVTAAKLQLKNGKGEARASIFHMTYERTDDQENSSNRPVVFAFNGGPGSSSVWLHLGALGPRIVPTSEDGTTALSPPYQVIPNPHSILDVADLVFIDPVSTGYSRVENDTKPTEFHGLEGDIESVGDFIRRWITEHQRWNSPKYLLGESYGGIRAAGLASHLQDRYGMHLNGVILLSSLLDFRTLKISQGDDLFFTVYLPVYTAVAHHHGKLEGDRDLLLEESKRFAQTEYLLALSQGNALTEEKKQATANRLSELSGISSEIWMETDLRLPSSRFRKELLREKGIVLGRFDARVAWPATAKASDFPHYDPSYSVAHGPFSTAMLDYLSREIGWKEDNPYEILSSKVRPWKWGTENGIVNLTSRLIRAMRDNPSLKVLVQCGHTDLATPPTGIEHSFRHLFSLPLERQKDIIFTYYEAGHMFYLNQPDLEKMRTDLVEFLKN